MSTRNTIAKALVLDAVRQLHSHAAAEDIYAFIAKKHEHISKTTVYNNLKTLSDAGEILRIEIPNQATRYDHNTHKHYHLRCRICGEVKDSGLIYDENLISPCKEDGFIVEGYNLILNGVCAHCENTTRIH